VTVTEQVAQWSEVLRLAFSEIQHDVKFGYTLQAKELAVVAGIATDKLKMLQPPGLDFRSCTCALDPTGLSRCASCLR
jgi:hypothetical protein